MESAQTLTQTAPSTDIATQQAREKAASIPEMDLQRELLAQLYLQNFNTKVQTTTLDKIKGHLAFYTIMYIIALFGAIAIFGK